MSKDVPTLKCVKDLLEGLLGRDVDVKEGDPVDCTPDTKFILGTYKEPDNRLGAIAVMDLPLMCYVGAALGLLPPGGAEDMAAEGDPSPVVVENSAEFLNVLAHPMFENIHVHQRLDAVFKPGDSVPADLANAAASTFRRDVFCEVKGYGGGNLSMICIDG